MKFFAVRHLDDKQAVGFFWVEGLEDLIAVVDEITEPDLCEIREIEDIGGFGWSSHVPGLGVERDWGGGGDPHRDMQSLTNKIEFFGAVEDFISEHIPDEEWKPLIPDEYRPSQRRPEPAPKVEPRTPRPAPPIETLKTTVYIIQSGDFVKIGSTSGPIKKRLKALSTAHHSELVLLGAIEDAPGNLELILHERFASLRVRGEWFRYEGALAEWGAGGFKL